MNEQQLMALCKKHYHEGNLALARAVASPLIARIKELEKKALLYEEAMLIRITSLDAEIKIMYDIKVP